MELDQTRTPWIICSILLWGIVGAAIAADCNGNGAEDGADLAMPILRAELLVPFSAGLAWGQPLAEDLNGDGLLDLIALEGSVQGDGASSHAVWLNLGGGRFDGGARYPTRTSRRWATAADLDGDGAPDLASVVPWMQSTSVALNDGEGRFSEPTQFPIELSSRFIEHGDFNGDGRIDLVTGHAEGSTIYLNGGSATFESHVTAAGPDVYVERLAAADLDGDGDPDLVLLLRFSSADIMLRSNEGAAFPASATLELSGEVEHLILEDLDNDGDVDLAAVAADPSPEGNGRLALFSNDGSGAFGPETTRRFRSPPVCLAAADADEDGVSDILVSSEDLLLFRGSGGGFTGPDLLDLATTAGLFVVRDLDGSGAPEVWTAKDRVAGTLGILSLAVAPWSIDCDRDGVPDECGTDCNGNRRADVCDAADGPDCNQSSIPDECEVDCNRNGIPDDCDLASGTVGDCNENGIPDGCERSDCNGNGFPDDCDVAAGRSKDCNQNLRPDECEGDCNSTGLPDDCDVALGTSLDGNGNSIPDECEAEPSFLYDFEQASAGLGAPGGRARLELRSRLHILGLEPGVTGTQSWALHAASIGCVPVGVSTTGTVAASVTDDPPGMLMDGFRLNRLVSRRELEQIGLPHDGGYMSVIVLSLVKPVSLDPAGSPYVVARALLEGLVPGTGCAECLVEYVNWRRGDGTGGTGGLPPDNVVTFRGASVYARREGQTVRFCGAQFHRGDANGDGRNDVSDAVAIFSYLFLGGPAPGCLEAANTDDSRVIDISDGIFLLTFLFLGGVVPPPPGAPSRAPCGPDPGGPQGDLGCERYDGC